MTHPDEDTLAAFVLDDAGPPEKSHPVEAHLDDCAVCRDEVEALHWILRLAGDTDVPVLSAATPWSVWDRIAAETAPDTEAATPRPPEKAAASQTSKVRSVEVPALRQRRKAVWPVAAAAVVGILLGAGGVQVLGGRPTPTTVISEVSLNTLDTKIAQGEADLIKTDAGLSLQITTQPLDATDGYLEVWLINRDLRRMVSVGVLGSGRIQSFYVPAELVDQGYVVVDVSREQYDDKPAHSGDSVVRGALA